MIHEITNFRGPYAFLSNFWYVKVEYNNYTYPSVEHAYQAAKAVAFSDQMRILNARTSALAKQYGRTVDIVPDWDKKKRLVMLDLLRQKFLYRDLCTWLLETKDAQIVEGNAWHDNYWGICYCAICSTQKQHNWLGRLLMHVRLETQIRLGIE